MEKEKVHSVEGYWDGPIAGIADYEQKPHYYDVVEDDAEDAGGMLCYTLTPLSDEIFAFAMDNWAIWQRWHKAHAAGEVGLDTHPALPEDKARYDAQKQQIDRYLFQHQQESIVKKGKFTIKKDAPSLNFAEFEVSWE